MRNELLRWYDQTKRDLPWRRTRDPYAIWLSEIMLQQTRTETVRGYWQRFLMRFPDVQSLAAADEQEVLKLWEGLGYYSRARNLHACAKTVCAWYGGAFPHTAAELKALPGIGDYTAGAVASIAFGERVSAVDGNVERVVSRVRGIREDVGVPSVRRALRAEAEALIPAGRPGDWNQAMMELGARVLRREEGLLRGLWAFPCPEGGAEALLEYLAENGVQARIAEAAGQARHVFTHRIWEMELFLLEAGGCGSPAGWRWASAEELAALPMPAAMKKARETALENLRDTVPSDTPGTDSAPADRR